jgi:hypothetical protein
MNRSQPHLPPGWNKHPPLPSHSNVAISSVLPGWQIAVIVMVAALLAAALAAAVYRTRVARQSATTSTT